MFQFFINFKTYREATGGKAVELAKICFKVAKQEKVKIISIVQAVDLFQINQEIKDSVWTQHLDGQGPGQATGWINLEAAIEAGATGTLLNHSEHRLPPGTIKQTIKRTKATSQEFSTMVCAGTLGQLKRLVFTKPDFLAYEIKELIAGSVSIAKARPSLVRKAICLAKTRSLPLVVGAGINGPEDVFLAKKMGAQGVLVSSAVVLAKNPREKLREMVKVDIKNL